MSAEEESPNTTAKKKGKKPAKKRKTVSKPAAYPRHSVDKALRIPKAILEQNAGKECTVAESAAFLGVGSHGPYNVEVSSGIKYGFLNRPSPGRIAITERAKKVLRPQALPMHFRVFEKLFLGHRLFKTFTGIIAGRICRTRNSLTML